MTFTLRKDQKHDIDRILGNPTKSALIATTVGGGKTATAVQAMHLATAEVTGRIILIIAPINTFDGWLRHIKLLTGQSGYKVGTGKEGQAGLDRLDREFPGWYVIGWEYARRFDFDTIPITALIGDEIHRQQNRKSANHTLFNSTARSVSERGGWVLALSATPYGNKAEGAFATCTALWGNNPDVTGKDTDAGQKRFDYFWPFVDEYIGTDWNAFANVKEPKRFERVPGGIAADMPLYIRHGQGYQCCEFHPNGIQADLPKRIVHKVPVDLAPAQRKVYGQMEARMLAWVDGCEYPIQSKGYPIVQSIRLRQIALAVPTVDQIEELNESTGETETKIQVSFALDAKSSKLDALVDILADIDVEKKGERVVVFTHAASFIPTIVDRINKAMKRNVAAAWMGGVSSAQRERIKDTFIQNAHADVRQGTPAQSRTPVTPPAGMDDVQVIVAQIGAIGEGVDGLQWVCSNEVWLSHEGNALLNVQALGRLERDGQLRAINSWDIVGKDTIEEDQLDSLEEQGERMRAQLNN